MVSADRSRGRTHALAATQLVLIIMVASWGVLAFGAVYPWTHLPLLLGCTAAGVIGFLRPVSGGPRLVPLFVTAGALVVAVMVQVVPMPPRLIQKISPHQPAFFKLYGESAEFSRIPLVLPLAEAEDRTLGAGPTALSIHPDSTWFGLTFLAAYAIFFLGMSRSLGRREVRTLSGAIVVLGLAVALIGIIQKPLYAGRIYGFWTPLSAASPFGPFVNRNHFAGWILMAMPLAFAYAGARAVRAESRAAGDWRSRVLWLSSGEGSVILLSGCAAAVMALSLVLTLSRSGIGSLALSGVVAATTVVRRAKGQGGRGLVLSYIAVVAIGVLGWTGLDRVAARFQGTAVDKDGRVDIWRDTLGIIRDFPLTGTGLCTFAIASVVYETPYPQSYTAEAHNDYLQLAAEGGVLLGVPIVLLIGLFIREVRRRFREDKQSGDRTTYWIRLGAACGLIAIAAQETVEFSLQLPGNAVLFLILAAIAVHRAGPMRQSPESAVRARPAAGRSPRPRRSSVHAVTSSDAGP